MHAFDGVHAVDGATLEVEAGSITGLIGPNGAGKSTLFNCISGFLRPQSGRVLLDGQRIDRRPPYRIARAGLVRTFQTPRVLTRMTVLENVHPRGAAATGASGWAARSAAARRASVSARGPRRELLELVRLDGHAARSPGRSPADSGSCSTSSAR